MPDPDRTEESPVRVIVADDDATMLFLVRQALEPSGYLIETVMDGQEAVQAFEREPADMVLLDVGMPRMDGLTACARIREHAEGLYTPIAMVTSCDDLASIQRAYQVGATDFITKPVLWPVFSHRLDYMLRASRVFKERVRDEGRHRALLEAVPDTILRLDSHGSILDAKLSGSEELVRLGAEQIVGRRLDEVYPADVAERLGLQLRRSLHTSTHQNCEFDQDVGDTKRFYEARFVASAEDEAIVIVRDVTDRIEAQAQMHRLAYYDDLTGLPNRSQIRQRLENAISRAKRTSHEVAILFIDLDDFKRVNDTLGHEKGDLLLSEVAKRLQQAVRMTDAVGRVDETTGPGANVARFGGDEFLAVLSDIEDAGKAAVAVARRLAESLSQPIDLDGNEVTVSASVGIATSPTDGNEAMALLRKADLAMYHAKSSGRNNFQFYSAPMNARARRRLELETEIRRLLKQDSLDLHFQPIFDPLDQRIVSLECLLRVFHPEHGKLPVPELIQVAEDSGLIGALCEKILGQACELFQEWQDLPHAPKRVAVNLSPQYLATADVVRFVESILAATGLAANKLVIEMTETALIKYPEPTGNTLRGLNRLGVKISLDDFGTGYSSLSHLLHYPIHQVKVDGTFTRRLGDSSVASAVVAAVISTGRELGTEVVVEHVETEAQLEHLVSSGCKRVQGYLFSPPLPVTELVELLRTGYTGPVKQPKQEPIANVI